MNPIPPEEVPTGPVFENIQTGNDVNVLAFPSPKWHELDGGPYIGTECMVINKDPESDWINVGTYRVQVQDEKTVSVYIEPGKHGNSIRQKYWDQGKACPTIVCLGQAPVLGDVAASGSGWGVSEFDIAGGRLGRPIQVVRGKITDLPFPADAELVLEGFVPPLETEARLEGPFGESPGYYSSAARPEPALTVFREAEAMQVEQQSASSTLCSAARTAADKSPSVRDSSLRLLAVTAAYFQLFP